MSSESPKPYQSRLFNFLNRQSLRLRDKIVRTALQLKIGAELGIQILLYPIYLLVQAGRMLERQLEQKWQKSNFLDSTTSSELLSQSLLPEAPINEVLDTVNCWLKNNPDQVSIDYNLKEHNVGEKVTPKIQGLTTYLENHHLALVTANNEFIELPEEYNQQLLQLISWELANYYYHCRLQENLAKKFPSLVSSFQTTSPTILPPIRWFWRLIRWLQIGPIARGINLFNESNLCKSRPPFKQLPSSDPDLESTTREITHSLSILSGNTFTVNSSISPENNSQSLNTIDLKQFWDLIRTAIDYFLNENKQDFSPDLNEQINNSLVSRTESGQISSSNFLSPQLGTNNSLMRYRRNYLQKNSKLTNHYQVNSWQIMILIQAAIDYFFSSSRKKKKILKTQTKSLDFEPFPTYNYPSLTEKTEADLWLSSEDLFPDSSLREKINLSPQTNKQQPQLSPAFDIKLNSETSETETIDKKIIPENCLNIDSELLSNPSEVKRERDFQKEEDSSLPITQGKKPKQVQIHKRSQNLSQKEPTHITSLTQKNSISSEDNYHQLLPKVESEALSNSPLENNYLGNIESDFVETEATPVGYVKHPLVKVLEWLDKIILWLEELFLIIWLKLKKFIRYLKSLF